MKRIRLVYVLLFLIAACGVSYSQVHFTAELTGTQEVPRVETRAIGTAALTLDDKGLSYIITVDNVEITGAHFHLGEIGVPGPVVRPIPELLENNTASGLWAMNDSIPLTMDLIDSLLMGKIYINIHSSQNPNGEIRGQVMPASGTPFKSHLTPWQEAHSVQSDAMGTGQFLLTEKGLLYNITVNRMESITGAHFHLGEPGVSGGVVKAIELQGNHAMGIWKSDDATEPLNDALMDSLLLGHIYVNLHSSQYPEGEIRGQVLPAGGMSFSTGLRNIGGSMGDTAQVMGTAVYTLTGNAIIYHITVSDSNATSAAFYQGTPGQGGVMIEELSGFENNSAKGVFKMKGSGTLDAQIILELLRGNIYLGVNTMGDTAGPGLSGQVMWNRNAAFKAKLTGFQERPQVATEAKGLGHFALTDEGLEFHISYTGVDSLTGAHFHLGDIGISGPVVRPITEWMGGSAEGIWRFTDSIALSDELLDSLLMGKIYVNLHTPDNPAGEIRGQVLLSSGTALKAHLSAHQQTDTMASDSVTSSAMGTGSFLYTSEGLLYHITTDSLNITGAQFRRGEIGREGDIVRDITMDFNGGSAFGLWRMDDMRPLNDTLVLALLLGNIYVNVSTPEYPNGEIRGQFHVSGGAAFAADMNERQVVPATGSVASGTGTFVLTPAGLKYGLTVTGMEPTGFTISRGPSGTSGDMITSLMMDTIRTHAHGVWFLEDTAGFSPENASALFNSGLYVSAASDSFPQGEIRGQIGADVPRVIVSVGDENSSIASGFALEQNYPNPFNPVTTIRFSVPELGPVNLTVFNILGEKVLTLVNENMPKGSYTVSFDASRLTSGVYLYRLSTGKYTAVKKMTLVK